jgi:hypothetical protein|nr:MAG TPA: hypothetical protein [Caudoviricetes sp.]
MWKVAGAIVQKKYSRFFHVLFTPSDAAAGVDLMLAAY